jgi:hypothetical protein
LIGPNLEATDWITWGVYLINILSFPFYYAADLEKYGEIR